MLNNLNKVLNMLKKVKEVIDRLKGNNSATEKLNILSEYKNDKDIAI